MPNPIHSGNLLVAGPFMNDPYFRESVVYMCEVFEGGSFGLVLNKRTGNKVHEVVEDFPETDAEVFVGGPVQQNTLHFLHRKGDILDESFPVTKGIWWGGNYEQLKVLVKKELILPIDIRFFLGYSGWDKGQLENEISESAWLITKGRREHVFYKPHINLWKETISQFGNNYSVIADNIGKTGMN